MLVYKNIKFIKNKFSKNIKMKIFFKNENFHKNSRGTKWKPN